MFESKVYAQRRKQLKKRVGSGIILLLGNRESPMNFADNFYHFRQDSTFLYFFGLNEPGVAAIIDVDEDRDIIFGDDYTVDQVVWMGPQPMMADKSRLVDVNETLPFDRLAQFITAGIQQDRCVHFLPPYRAGHAALIEELLGIHASRQRDYASVRLIKAIVALREVKSDIEVEEIEAALRLTYEMQTTAMKIASPEMYEREVVGIMEGMAYSLGGRLAFPIIFSIHGETLHNHSHDNLMAEGDIVVNDSGAETESYYASDITRTFPVSGRFTQKQRDIYQIVLDAQEKGIQQSRPGVPYRDVHLQACQIIGDGLKSLGLMKGDPKEAVAAGAHALFLPHGLGHMMGLDVHDMENFGEDYVGYDEATHRSKQFGFGALRIAKELRPGFVITVEPGIYFIPELIDQWQAESKFSEYINYQKLSAYRDFGGIRIEDDVLLTDKGGRILGKPIPKSIEEVEALSSS